MPAYNAEKTIKSSIDSVLAQTFTNWELIIIDDASKDGTLAMIPKHPQIIAVTNKANLGVAQSRNNGINHAKGKWLAFLDSDDLWQVDKLEKQLAFMEGSGGLISYTATAYMNESNEMYAYMQRAKPKLSYKELLKGNLMSCSSVMVRHDVMMPFPQGHLHEDYAVWLAIVKKLGYACGLDEPLLTYRMSEGSKSSNRISSGLMTYNAYRNCLVGYGRVTSALLTVRYAFHSIAKRKKIKQ